MRKTRTELIDQNRALRERLVAVRDLMQENRVADAIAAADVAIGPNAERVELPPGPEPPDTVDVEYRVCAWSPHPVPGVVPPTQVHFVLNVAGMSPMAVRLKSPRAVDDLISLLGEYRGEVWGGRPS